jgi:hypothetical protein
MSGIHTRACYSLSVSSFIPDTQTVWIVLFDLDSPEDDVDSMIYGVNGHTW